MSVVLQAFAYKPKHLTNYIFELVVVLDESLRDHQSYNSTS